MDMLKKGVSGFELKLFALVVMTLDHIHYFAPEGAAPYWLTLAGRLAALLLIGFCVGNLLLVKVTPDAALYVGCTAAAAVPICLYNGTPGKHRCKWLFYFYYPAHVYTLYLLGWWLLRA